MNVLALVEKSATDSKPARDPDSLDFERLARGLMAFHPPAEAIPPLLDRARGEIPGLASLETVLRIYAHNPDCLFALARADNALEAFANPSGFIAQLPLNAAGAEALLADTFDTAEPPVAYLCRQNERPSAIYIWGIFISHKLAGGIALVMERLSSEKNRDAPLYCKATSEKSQTFFISLGFQPGVMWRGHFLPELMEYQRAGSRSRTQAEAPETRAAYDSVADAVNPLPIGQTIGVTVVHNLDDLQKVFAIRAATYIAEQNCPHAEEFDGNDFTATHLLGYIGREPAGCMRIRYFAGFAKLERLAVLGRHRQSRLAFELIRASIAFCRTKGYRRLYGHAEPRMVKLWERFGFEARTNEPTFGFSGLAFVEGDVELAPDSAALSAESDPYVLLRPEGRWSRPGVLDPAGASDR